MAGKYTIRSKEEKLAIVKRNLAGETSWSLERETGMRASVNTRVDRKVSCRR